MTIYFKLLQSITRGTASLLYTRPRGNQLATPVYERLARVGGKYYLASRGVYIRD
jgi:hypothetical protein